MEQGFTDTKRKKTGSSLRSKCFWQSKFLLKWVRLWRRLKKALTRKHLEENTKEETLPEEESWENPYLDDFRNILIQILDQRQMPFGEFRPILIDSDEPDQSFLTEEDTVRLLAQIGEGLNALEILTDRPEYFRYFSERMNTEYGLLTQIYPRDYDGKLLGNVVLDLERHSALDMKRWEDKSLYIPFYKRKWQKKAVAKSGPVKSPEQEYGEGQRNLDIEVPIGYNIVTVKTRASDIQNRL